ncbi:hypothetical protein TcasGA2_TC030955 [Tribolium castaneum]|uniref:Endonuclease/exonuclease/phosphatase domain-containing protein n=1 Tax=Tribolium castaneum TaxID=7070 RepID=A0A139W9H8_TRICA|nr:hypothetical protein TcasGA2_TC030955 [Tribolium castaneum]
MINPVCLNQNKRLPVIFADAQYKVTVRNLENNLELIPVRKKVDLITFSEPNRLRCIKNNRHLYTNNDCSVAILNASQIFNVTSYRTGECYVCVNVEDFIVYSVFISPNCSENMFNENLSDLFNDVRIARIEGRRIIITGDFNAKNNFWVGQITDKRGEVLLETTESMGLYILNDGGTPTLERINGSSYIDITIASEEIIERNPIWTVLEDEISMSDHHFILLEVPMASKRQGKSKYILEKRPKMDLQTSADARNL